MSSQHYILATAGHVDHGKSALIKALTGTDPDRLPEEKARGITIDLGFAHLELEAPQKGSGPSAPAKEPRTFSLGIIDVPGHEDFVKNMVAGVGSINVALLVVAADDGWMPQTEEHLQILTYLGVNRAVVALTKIDLMEVREEEIIKSVREKLHNSPFAEAPIVPTSVVTGRGLTNLKTVLAELIAEVPPPADIGKPRLAIDRAFILKGIGTVVTGTVNGGVFRRGQTLVIQPAGTVTRVRTLHHHNEEVELGLPGTRTAVNLPDIHPGEASRGSVLTLPELGGPSTTLYVLLERSARLMPNRTETARLLKERLRIRIHHGPANYAAMAQFLDGATSLAPGQCALARLRLESPVYAFAGDRFIVRDSSEQTTLAGGVVLDPDPAPRRAKNSAIGAALRPCIAATADAAVFVTSQLARDGLLPRARLLLKSRFSNPDIEAWLTRLSQAGRILLAGNFVADVDWWSRLSERAIQAIDREHKTHPERAGLALADLRAEVGLLASSEVFDTLIANLVQDGFRRRGTAIQRVTHRAVLPLNLQAQGNRIRTALAERPFEPPSRKELAPDASSQQALRFLIDTGEVVEISAELVLSSEGYHRAIELIKQELTRHGSATVSDLRKTLGSSRRIMVPLLEKLDREGVTRREGEMRVLGRSLSPSLPAQQNPPS